MDSAGGPIVQCPRCQQHNVPQAKFCQECGTPLSVAARFASPDGYTPKHLADRILTSKSALEGERKQVTVLFADMKGSMELLADRDPEQAREILDPVLELMMDAVHRYEGTVNQVMGDGIMALFGAPVAHEDHTVRGCYAALLMQESVKRYAAASGHEGLQIRIGLNSGDVVVRSIGSDLRMDYSALGQTTHLAARMEQLAAPGSILIPAGALRLAEGYVEVKRLDSVHVKGMIQPVEVCEITGAGAVRTRFQLSAARGLTRFVGRAAELRELHRALQQTREGHGQVCAVIGQAGLGKSRLFHEFIHSPATKGCLVLESVAASYGKARPYLPFINLVRDYFHIDDRDDSRKITEKMTGRLLSTDPATLAGLPALLTLVDVSVHDPRWDALDPSQRRYETLDAVRRLLLWETRIQPVVIVIENLHWIDYESQALLDSLMESVPTARLLLLVNYRPEYHHAWGERNSYHQLRLDPLPPDGARDFLDALVGEDLELGPLKQLLIERTEGNPFFIEETVRGLVETGLVIGTRGRYRLACDITSIDIAPTVQAVLAARIDRLSSTNKRLLQCAAVIGKDVPFALLRAISDESDDEIYGGLHALQTAEFLYEATLFPEVKYTFKHALTHEVAYGSLLHDRRRVLHLRIAEAIEALYPDRLTEYSERLAHHAFRAESWGKAVTYLRESGAKALMRSAHRESAAHLEQALMCLQHLPQTRERLEQAIDIRFDLRNALLSLAQFDRIHGYLREAEGLARKLDDRRRLGWLLTYMCHYLWMTGRSTEARAFGQDAQRIAETLGDFRLTVVVSFYLALASFAGGGYRQAEQLLRNAIRSLPADLSRERCGLAGFPAVMSRAYLGLALGILGEFEEGTALAQEGLHLAEEADHPYSVIVSGWGLGSVHTVRGNFADAARVFERARRVCHEWNQTVLLPLVGGSLGYVYTLAGRVAEGRALLQQALDGMQSMRRGAYHSQLTLQLGEAAARAGEFGEASEFAEHALALARERGERGYEADALRLLGQIDAQRNPLDVDATSARYRLALAMADELGMKPLVARCHLDLGALLRRAGMMSESRAQLAKASDMFRAMTMTFWSEQTEAELERLE